MDPVLEEFCRAHVLQTHAFRRMQRYFRDELGPKIDRMEAENAELKSHLAALDSVAIPVPSQASAEPTDSELPKLEIHMFGGIGADQPVKRKRGRPRKHPITISDPIAV